MASGIYGTVSAIYGVDSGIFGGASGIVLLFGLMDYLSKKSQAPKVYF